MRRYIAEALVIAGFFNLFLFGIALILALIFIPLIFSIMIFCLLLGTTIPITAGVCINRRIKKTTVFK